MRNATQVVLHPRSLVSLGGLWGAGADIAGFGARAPAAHPAGALDEWLDRVRRFAEECDALQARQPALARWPRAASTCHALRGRGVREGCLTLAKHWPAVYKKGCSCSFFTCVHSPPISFY